MRDSTIILIMLALLLTLQTHISIVTAQNTIKFDKNKDLLIMQFDCKTDVDDIHAIASYKTILSSPAFSKINHYAVAGSYGIQNGPYVNPNKLMKLAFKKNWTDAHKDIDKAAKEVEKKMKKVFKKGGDIWIAEAGQSDFTSKVVKLIKKDLPNINTGKRIHVVQHSKWNENMTAHDKLDYVIKHTDYHKIADGNVGNNGTPNFQSLKKIDLPKLFNNTKLLKVWQEANAIIYNEKEVKKHNINSTIAKGGIDFSDLVETCWILGKNDLENAQQFFELYAQ